jgi:hypothetical protein
VEYKGAVLWPHSAAERRSPHAWINGGQVVMESVEVLKMRIIKGGLLM